MTDFFDKFVKLGKPIIDLVENNIGKIMLVGLAGLILIYFMIK